MIVQEKIEYCQLLQLELQKFYQRERQLPISKPRINKVPIESYYKWNKSDNEIIAYCGYGYCDMPIPKTYNCLFDLDNPDQPIEVNAEVKHSIWNGILPIDSIEHGHKIICIISFNDDLPDMVKRIPKWKYFESGKYRYGQFGLCDRQDLELIIAKNKRV